MNPLLVLSLVFCVSASPGDNLDEFINCNKECSSYCDTGFSASSSSFRDVSPLLRLLAWDCVSNCDYQCQQLVTDDLVARGVPVEQFHGKWPFTRLLGTQELASVVFSMLNFIPHYINMKRAWNKYVRVKETIEGGVKVLYWNVYIVAVITSLAWLFSTVFHVRDLDITEKLDYYFAGLTVLSGFHYLTIRSLSLHNNRGLRRKVTLVCCLMFVYHVARLTRDWSYTYNMQANIFVALLQYSLFLVLAYRHYKQGQIVLAVMPIALLASVLFGMSFEVFDFFWRDVQVDAHAVWHAVTVVPGFYLYEFFYKDIETLRGYVD